MNSTAAIPQELRALNQWVRWKFEKRGKDKPTKVPLTVTGQYAKSDDPATWATFGAAVESDAGDGIGFVFSEGDPYCGIDLDDAIDEHGTMKPWAIGLVRRLNTYTEISPSGRGVKLWIRGHYPGDETGRRVNYRDGKVEMYHTRRFFTVTGQAWPGTPDQISDDQAAVDGIYRTILTPPKPVWGNESGPAAPESTVERCMKYIEKCPDAVSGESGHDRTFRVACECYKFGLSDSDAWRVMEWFNNSKCKPPWTRKEIEHKLRDAHAKVASNGELGARIRSLTPPRVPISKPPAQSTSLEKLIRATIAGERVAVPFGEWRNLTNLSRALLPGTITVLSGAGGSAKSMMVSQACLYWLDEGYSFAVFHLEEDRDFHLKRAIAQIEGNSGLNIEEWEREHAEQTLEALKRTKPTTDELGKCIWDAPATDVDLGDLTHWVQERCAEKRRIIVVDPVTAADSGREPWRADRLFVMDCKRALRESGSSMIVVTHPRDGNPKHGSRMDNHAGGQAYNRFTQTVLELRSHKAESAQVYSRTPAGTIRDTIEINRTLAIHKARNGPGAGEAIGFDFDGRTLRFKEAGVLDER